jgi:hypothetical protein
MTIAIFHYLGPNDIHSLALTNQYLYRLLITQGKTSLFDGYNRLYEEIGKLNPNSKIKISFPNSGCILIRPKLGGKSTSLDFSDNHIEILRNYGIYTIFLKPYAYDDLITLLVSFSVKVGANILKIMIDTTECPKLTNL